MKRLILLVALPLLVACGSQRPHSAAEAPPLDDAALQRSINMKQSTTSATIGEPLVETDAPPETVTERVIISSAKMQLETETPDSVHNRTIEYAYAHNGYVLDSKPGSTAIRIPASQFHDALVEIETWGLLKAKKITSNDVTNQFFDLQTRLVNAEKTRERYLLLLSRANSISEVLRVERELERINQLIETYKGKLAQFEHWTLLSTITVSTQQKTRAGWVGSLFTQTYKGLKWLFVRN